MNRLFAVKPLLVVAAALAIALVLACGGRGETTSPGSLLRLLPQNADSFTFADLEQLRDERLNNLEQQLASLIGEGRLDDWEIDLDDASSLVLSDPNSGDALIILRGRFVVEDVEDALDDDGLRDSVHRDVTVWSERRGGVALAFVGEDVIVIGEEERVEDSVDVFIDEARSMDRDDEAEAIVDALEDALVYSVAEDCGYRACRRQGSAVRVEAGDLVAVFAFLFRNDDAAADAEGDIEDDLENLVDDPRTETDGEMVIAESPVDEDQLGLDRNGALAYRLEGDGSTSGRGSEEEPSQAPERPRFGDDHGDDRSGATRIRDGEFLDGDIELDGDRDFFSFSAERGREYRIETHLGFDTVLVLYGPDGDYLVEDDDSGDSGASRLEWVAPSSDTYYIEVSGFESTTGTYQLSLSVLGAQPLDDRSGATRIRDGEFLDGDIELDGDRDFFFFSAERGREYRIETHLGFDTVLVLYGPDGDYLVEDDDSGEGGASLLEWVAPSSDTYYIEVSGFSGTLGTYQLSLSVLGAQPPDDHGDDRSGATRIRDGEFLDGDIERDGDRDFFFFSAERGREYRIETYLGSNSDTVLVLYGPDGGYLVEDDDSGEGGASLLEWVAPSSDTYYIEVSGFESTTGTYQLSLLELGRPATEVTAIGPGDTVEGRIGDEEDRGYFEFSAQRGREYVIETHLGSISDTVLVLTGPGGLRLEDDDSGDGAASRLYWTAPESDEYLIEVTGYGDAIGSYGLSLTELERDPTPTPPRRDARYGGELALALAEEPFEDGFSPRDNFSAGASQIYSLIFSRLWRTSPESPWEVVGDLVEWWSIGPDGREWTLGLRQDARFHDGRRVTARDAEYSIEAFSLVDFADVSVIDDYTLRIEFEEPNISFANTMASSWRAIVVPRGLLDAPIGRFTDLVGSGPFVPAEHNRNSVSTVGRNPDYYEGGLPFLDTVSLYVAPERTTRTAAFQAGEFHFLGYPYSRTTSGHFPPLTNQEHATVSRNAAFGTYPVVFALWFDTRALPFSDPRVRLAVNRAIDRNALDSLWAAGEPQGPVPEALFPAWRTRLDGPRELNEWNRYDPELASRLLAEAGYPEGFFTSIQVPPNPPQTWSDLAASISDMLWDGVGIYAEVVESDFNAPTEWGIKLAPVIRFGQDIDRFFIEHFGAGGEYNYSRTRLDPPLPGPNDLNSIIGLHQELVEQVYYIPLPAPLYARSESVGGPLWAELYDLSTTLRHVWLEN